MQCTTLSEDGKITLPKKILKDLGVESGGEILFIVDELNHTATITTEDIENKKLATQSENAKLLK